MFFGESGFVAEGREEGGNGGLVLGEIGAAVADEGFTDQLAQGEAFLPGQGVAGGDGDAEGVAIDLVKAQAAELALARAGGEGDVETVFAEAGEHFGSGEIVQEDADLGHGGLIAAEDAGEDLDGEGWGVADVEFAGFSPGEGADGGHGLIGAGEDGLGFGDEKATSLGETDGLRTALEKRDAEVILEIAHLTADGGLSDVQAGGGAGDILLFGDGDEVAEVAELHVTTSMPRRHTKARNMVFPNVAEAAETLPMITLRKANERGHAEHGWLDTYHTFSFADYYDPQWMGFRSLRVINDDLVLPRNGFGMHPHRDMEIITYILSGSLTHRDSMGNGRTITPGEFQYMSAGTGVMHSEQNQSGSEAVHLLQIWIQPDTKGVAPNYAEKSMKDAEPGRLHLITSKTGRDGSIAIHQDADLWLARLDPAQSVNHTVGAGRHAWLHVAEGEVTLNGQTLSGGDAVAVTAPETLEIAGVKPAQVLLFDLN